jgi:type II secretory pathway pseudopilin PulG
VTRISGISPSSELGVTFIETIVALAILGLVAVVFLSGLATSSKATIIANERATAESLVRSEVEYVKNYTYQYDTSDYPVDPALSIPVGWTLPLPVVELVHATDDGLQKVTVTAEHDGEAILSVAVYKVDR